MSKSTTDKIKMDQETAKQNLQRAIRLNSPSMMLKPKLSIDGDKWCALHGENLQDGVAGFGNSPKEAYLDFDENWKAVLPHNIHKTSPED